MHKYENNTVTLGKVAYGPAGRAVMNNSGFGDFSWVIKMSNGAEFSVRFPQQAIRQSDGSLKKHVIKLIQRFTIADMAKLNETYGVEIEPYRETKNTITA